MPDVSTLAMFLAAALALNITPGPDMLFCLGAGAAGGRQAGIAAALGVGAGCLVHTMAAAVGLAGLLLAYPTIFDAVRWAGALYLAWIALKALRAALVAPVAVAVEQPATLPSTRLGRLFVDGAVTNVLNPKVALFFLAFLPQFVSPTHGPIWSQMLVLGCVMTVSGTCVNALVGALAGGAVGRLTRDAAARRWLQGATGLLFLGMAARLAFGSGGGRSS